MHHVVHVPYVKHVLSTSGCGLVLPAALANFLTVPGDLVAPRQLVAVPEYQDRRPALRPSASPFMPFKGVVKLLGRARRSGNLVNFKWFHLHTFIYTFFITK